MDRPMIKILIIVACWVGIAVCATIKAYDTKHTLGEIITEQLKKFSVEIRENRE